MNAQGPASESLRLADNYRQMSDGELIDLAQHPSELTEMAQGILAQEMSSRKLKVPPAEDRRPLDSVAGIEDVQDESPYAEDRKLVNIGTVWSRRDAEQVQELLEDAGIPFVIGPEKMPNVDEVRSSFADGLDVLVMRITQSSASSALESYHPQDEPGEEKNAESEEFAIHCPKCHSTDVVFEDPGGVEPEDDTITQKFDWECAACGHKWEDQGGVSKS